MTDRLRVLLLEDNPGDVALIRAYLRDEVDAATHYDIIHEPLLDAAIDHAIREPVDIALLDLSLPDASGLDSCERFMARVPNCPPVIVLTGLSDEAVAMRAVATGAQDFLRKGAVDRAGLERAIRYAVERGRISNELHAALAREQLIVEQLTELDRLKSRFVAMASHELRTPLASITGFATTLRDRWDDIHEPDRLKFLGIIDDQGRRLARLVDNLLVLSSIESGVIAARPEELPLDRAIRLVVGDLGNLDHRVTIDVPRELTVVADRDHLEQMLVNYVTNALKYGSDPIVVEGRVDNGLASVRVRDHGVGVPADVAPTLFEEFSRARSHSDAGIEGTGLGLSIVRGLARAGGGDAWYEPNQPTGSVFAFSLPLSTA
ncbi:MAG: response regulator receiver sensor signal transduction histidine kinase [Thermoleophilia bacterium]|nr:response regulator receiver sensor signal transduction histidine kinase [Thermoleophilia bacterium]